MSTLFVPIVAHEFEDLEQLPEVLILLAGDDVIHLIKVVLGNEKRVKRC